MTVFIELYLVAVAISLDCFAAALALGTRIRPRGWLRVGVVFALLGGAFPVLGMWLGVMASGALARLAGVTGALVLAGLGGWFLHGALRPGPGTVAPAHLGRFQEEIPTGGLVLLSVGVSSDNLLVGLGFGLQGEPTFLLGAVTAFSVFGATLTGLWLGQTKRKLFGRVAEGLAGVLLLGLAAWLLLGGTGG